MHRGETGRYEVTTAGGERVRAFVPAPVPPVPPTRVRRRAPIGAGGGRARRRQTRWRLIELNLARELTGKRRNRLFVYDRYLAILNEGTEMP
jgi:hypothetical protein